MAQYETAANIIEDVAIELGLATAVEDAFASTDANIVQLRSLLKRVGRRLVMENEWLQLRRDFIFSTNGSGSATLPDGYLDIVDGTVWNRTTQRQMVPVSPQQWEALQANVVTATIVLMYRVRQTTLQIFPSTATGDFCAMEYRTRFWVADSIDGAPTADAPTTNVQVLKIDEHLLTRALKLAYLGAKGFDTTDALDDYNSAFALVRGANGGTAPVLSLNGNCSGIHLIDGLNVPDTGYGG